MNILNPGLSTPGPSPLYPPQPYSLGNERELKKQMKILELKKVNKRIHQPKKKSLIIQTYGIRHYMKKLFNSGNSQDKPSLQQQVNQFDLGHVETQTMQTADCRLQTMQTVQTESYFFTCTTIFQQNFYYSFLLPLIMCTVHARVMVRK